MCGLMRPIVSEIGDAEQAFRDTKKAGVAKLVDVPDLGSGAARHGGSSPSTRTSFYPDVFKIYNFLF